MKAFIVVLLMIVGTAGTVAADRKSEGKTIYKSTDESGRPVFSDAKTEGAEEIHVREPETFSAPPAPQPTAPAGRERSKEEISYTRLAITSPADGETIRSNAGNLQVDVQVSPPPRDGHTLQLLMDGAVYRELESASGSVHLTNVDRGTHALQLRVVDSNNKLVKTGTPVTIHLLRHSILHPQGRKAQN